MFQARGLSSAKIFWLKKVSIEGDQVVDWSRWCRQEGSWQRSVLDRSGFIGEKPINKDIRFPSDVCKGRAFAKFCGKVSLKTRPALSLLSLWQTRSFFQRGTQEEAGVPCPAIILILLSVLQAAVEI